VLARHPEIAATLAWSFEARFDPALPRATRESQVKAL
jgi:hypothetical protein